MKRHEGDEEVRIWEKSAKKKKWKSQRIANRESRIFFLLKSDLGKEIAGELENIAPVQTDHGQQRYARVACKPITVSGCTHG